MFTQLGPYRVLKERASGHRPVFEAIDQIYHRKVFLNECPGNVPVEDILQRVDDGGRVFTALNHPNIARVFGFVRRNDRVYLVTEWVEGATLQEILDARGTMPVEMAMTLFRQVLAGIASAHALGVVHGDLKPENLAVPDFGPIKILDLAFQHAFRVDAPTLEGANHRYLSPEQLQGQPADVRSDIYSLGLMLYETVVGRTPFDPYGSLDANVRVEVIPISPALLRDDIPQWLDALLLGMIAPAPESRFQSAERVIRLMDSRSSVYRARKRIPRSDKKNIGEEGTPRLKDRLRPGLRTAAPAAAPRWHRFASAFKRGSANRAVRAGKLSGAWGKAAVKLRRGTGKSLYSITSRSSVRAFSLLLTLIFLDSFYFGGAHVSLLVPVMPAPISLNDSVDAMYARLDQESRLPVIEPLQLQKHAVAPAEQPKLTHKSNHADADHKDADPLPKRDITAAEKVDQTTPRAAQRPRSVLAGTEPQTPIVESKPERSDRIFQSAAVPTRLEPDSAGPVRTAQNNASDRLLSVKWED